MSQHRILVTTIACVLSALGVLLAAPRQALPGEAPPEIALTMTDRRFTPEELRVKAGAPFMLVVKNQGAEEGEFEIPELRIEQEIPAGKTKRFKIPGLRPGTYSLINDTKGAGAKGRLIAE